MIILVIMQEAIPNMYLEEAQTNTPVMQKSPLRSAHRQAQYRRQNFYAWLFVLLQALIAAAVIFVLFLTPVRVNGASMSPTLHENDVLLIDRLSLFLRAPKRGDIVIFAHPGTGEELIKRVVALPGETVELYDGHVYIDGFLLDESDYMPSPAEDYPAVYVRAHTVFVLGDDRDESLDSRDPALGLIDMSALDGRVRFRVAPLERAAVIIDS